MADDLLKVGHINSPCGVHGWVWVYSNTDPMDNVFEYGPWQLRRGDRLEPVEVLEWRPQGKGLVARIKGVDDRNAAQKLFGAEIVIPRSALPALAEDEFYWSDLTDKSVYAASGEFLGRVHGIMETGANDVLVVRGCDGSIDKRERLIPWVPDEVVKQVDLEAGKLVVDWDPEF